MASLPGARARIEVALAFIYWLTANNCADRARVFAIADFMINPARAGTQAHMEFSDERFKVPLCRFSEPTATIAIKTTAKRAKRLMG